MADDKLISISKYLSYILRHQPQSIGLDLDANGWAEIDELIACAARDGRNLTREIIEEIVAGDEKQRYTVSDDGLLIRANQGHSVAVDLQLKEAEPPDFLYHGTARTSVPAIRKQGLKPMKRHHVHLSMDEMAARQVGQRYGEPVILLIDCQAMRTAGHLFYLSQNGVWLTDAVPPEYINVIPDPHTR